MSSESFQAQHNVVSVKVADVVYRTDIYPRIETSPQTVQVYAENIEKLPPIEVNQHNELIDGWHRWTAHKKNELEEIKAVVVDTPSQDALSRAILVRKSSVPVKLTDHMARRVAKHYFDYSLDKKNATSIISDATGRTMRSVNNWISAHIRSHRQRQIRVAKKLRADGMSQDRIAVEMNVSQSTVSNWLKRGLGNGSTGQEYSFCPDAIHKKECSQEGYVPHPSICVPFKIAFPLSCIKPFDGLCAGVVDAGVFYVQGTMAKKFLDAERTSGIAPEHRAHSGKEGKTVYFVQAGNNGPIKIGSSGNVLSRLNALQTAHYEKLKIIAVFPNENNTLEQFMHSTFCRRRIRGEWFDISVEDIRWVAEKNPDIKMVFHV